jgi:hypothetical protein
MGATVSEFRSPKIHPMLFPLCQLSGLVKEIVSYLEIWGKVILILIGFINSE